VTRLRRALVVVLALALAAMAASCSTYRLGDRNLASADGSADGRAGGSRSGAGDVVSTDPGVDPSAIPGLDPSGGGGGRGPAANVVGGDAERVASDRGVTPDTITLGILTPNEELAADLGVTYNGRKIEEIAQPFIDEINDQGGINGRRVVPAFTRFNPASADNMLAACVNQAEDRKVFASLALLGFYGEGEVCLANKQVPTISSSNSSEFTLYEREKGWVRQTTMNKDRTLRNWIDWIVQSGTATPDTRIGLVYTDVPEDRQVVQETVVPYLKEKGLNVAETAVFTLSSIDAMVAEAQRGTFRFKANDIQLVLPVTNFLQFFLFIQQADLIGYVPRYTVTDFGAMATDATAFYPPTQWEGVMGTTSTLAGQPKRNDIADTPAAQDCLRVYNEAGLTLNRNAEDPRLPDTIEVAGMQSLCQHIALFADAARRAGVNPTRQSFLDAIGNTGTWSHRVVETPPLDFRPDRYDSADSFAVVRWQSRCYGQDGCYRRVEGFRPGR